MNLSFIFHFLCSTQSICKLQDYFIVKHVYFFEFVVIIRQFINLFRSCKRMRVAKSVCIYQPRSLLCCGNSFSCSPCFHLPYWRHGRSPSLIFCSLSLSESEISMFSYSNFFFVRTFLLLCIIRGFGWGSYVASLCKLWRLFL